jgi:hypothetical protein
VAFRRASKSERQRQSEASLPRGGREDRASHPCIRSIRSRDLNHDAVMRIGGEAPQRQAHSLDRHRSHAKQRVTPTSDRLGIYLTRKRINARSVLSSRKCLDQSRSCSGTHDGTGRDLTDGDIAPQGDQQFACQCDDHNFAQCGFGASRPCSIPLRQVFQSRSGSLATSRIDEFRQRRRI